MNTGMKVRSSQRRLFFFWVGRLMLPDRLVINLLFTPILGLWEGVGHSGQLPLECGLLFDPRVLPLGQEKQRGPPPWGTNW